MCPYGRLMLHNVAHGTPCGWLTLHKVAYVAPCGLLTLHKVGYVGPCGLLTLHKDEISAKDKIHGRSEFGNCRTTEP